MSYQQELRELTAGQPIVNMVDPSDYSKINLTEPAENMSDSQPTAKIFRFRRRTEKNSPRSRQSSIISKPPSTVRSHVKKNSVDVSSFLYLGMSGDPNVL